MHHHDITLLGSADEIDAFRADLVAAGAQHLTSLDRVHLVWGTDGHAPVAQISAAHPEVDVSLRRFPVGDDCVDELAMNAGRVFRERKRRTLRDDDGDVGARWGSCMDEGGSRLDPAVLRQIGREVLDVAHGFGPRRLSTAIYDALLLSEELGRLAAAFADPLACDSPDSHALDALRHAASVALTIGCTALGPHTDDQLLTSRTWRMHEVIEHAGSEDLWATPGEANWLEWSGHVLSCTACAVKACIDSAMYPVWEELNGAEARHLLHPDRHVEATLGALVSTCIQALALFTT